MLLRIAPVRVSPGEATIEIDPTLVRAYPCLSGARNSRGYNDRMKHLGDLSNEELLESFRTRVKRVNADEASIVAHLVEIERRRLHLDEACSSMWTYCLDREGFSENQAYVRLAAARVVNEFPLALEYLERGDLHLCGLAELRRALTSDNHEELLREASGKSTRAVKELVAARMPKPDVAPRIEPIAPQAALPVVMSRAMASATQDEPRPKIEPLSATRYRIEATVSAEAKEVIEDIKNLMAHRNPTRDLGIILEAALREYRATL